MHYWCTRVSTVSISISGTAFLVLGIVLEKVLDMHYGCTRVSAVSISISGTAFLVLGIVLEKVLEIAYPLGAGISNELDDFILMLSSFLLMPFIMIQVVAMIMTITRAEFGWLKGTTWIPIVQRSVATRKERASMRSDAQTSWRAKGGVSCHFETSPLSHMLILNHGSSFFPSSGSTISLSPTTILLFPRSLM